MYRLLLVLLLLTFVGCTQSPTAPTHQAMPTTAPIGVTDEEATPIIPSEQATPSEQEPSIDATSAATGTGAISGRVVSTSGGEPIRDTVIFLAQVYADPNSGEKAFALDLANSPASFTDQEGNFKFTGIAPGEYVISVGDFYGIKDIVREPNGDARVYQLENNQPIDAGTVQVRPDVSPGQ